MEEVYYWVRFSGYIILFLTVCSSRLTSSGVDRPPPQQDLLFTAIPSLLWWTETRIQNELPCL